MKLLGLSIAALLLCACASAPPPPPTAAPSAQPSVAPAQVASFDRQAPARIETETYLLELVTAADASLVQPTAVSLTLEGRGGFHVNLEYPLRVTLGGSRAMELDKTTLDAADATELSEARARFDRHVRWSAAGPQWLAARVRFAVCTPDACVPQERELAVALTVIR